MQYILKTSRKQANKNIESLDKREGERERTVFGNKKENR
jgi:hypothetical protein